MDVEEWVRAARAPAPALPEEALLDRVRMSAMPGSNGDLFDANEAFRAAVCETLNGDTTDSDRPLARFLLEQETAAHELGWGVSDSLPLCAYLLFKLGHVEDALPIWRAKTTNFDTHCGVDVQLLAGAGVEETVAWLRSAADPEAVGAADYLEECRASGDFDGDYRAALRQRYGEP